MPYICSFTQNSHEKFEDIKWTIRSGKWKKNRQYKEQLKKGKMKNNDLRNTTQKTKDRASRNILKTGGEFSINK